MAELTIRLAVDPRTGKKNLTIAYHGEDDALPMEHEEEHRRLVDQLIEGGALARAELGSIIVERERPPQEGQDAASEPAAEPAAGREAIKSSQR